MDLISDSHVPKYAQIADIFRQRISRGIWAQGLRLPATLLQASKLPRVPWQRLSMERINPRA
jgi:GntR family transcriptional regulator